MSVFFCCLKQRCLFYFLPFSNLLPSSSITFLQLNSCDIKAIFYTAQPSLLLNTTKIYMVAFSEYRKVASTSPSHLKAQADFCRLFVKGKFNVYLL